MSRVDLKLYDYLILAMYPADTRTGAEEKIREALRNTEEDAEITDLLGCVLEKLAILTDEEYRQLDLEPYRQEPVEEDENDNEEDDDLE